MRPCLAAVLLGVVAKSLARECSVCLDGAKGNSKLDFDLSTLPSGPFQATDSFGDKYYLSSPCGTFEPSASQCGGKGFQFASSAFQFVGEYGCIPLGNSSQVSGEPLSWANEQAGIRLVQSGGSNNPQCGSGRRVVFRGVCDSTAPVTNGPDDVVVENPRCTYNVNWSHPAFCAASVPGSCPAGPTSLPKPSGPQLAWQRLEIGGLTHFNMATFSRRDGDPACDASNWNTGYNTSNPATFAPSNLNISNWIESYKALGAGYGVLTAKHGCGFLLFDTASRLPARLGGGEYFYAVKRKSIPSYPKDVAQLFADGMQAAGLGHGFYYSTTNNFAAGYVGGKQLSPLLHGQLNLTMDEFNDLVFAQLAELWSNYGKLTEIWLDHGYAASQQQRLVSLIAKLQPDAVAFNGYGVASNPSRWVGTEDGTPAYPIWSTGTSGQGDPDSSVWNPAVTDTTLQDGDHWFYLEGDPIRDLATLVDVYHASVGANSVLELDFAIDLTGNVHPTHAAAYKALGDWARACYGSPVASTSGNGGNITLPVGGATVDRFIVQEDQTYGQRVRAFTIEAQLEAGGAWTEVASGSSIGHKRIAIAQSPVGAQAVRFVVQDAAASPIIMAFAAFAPCPVPSSS